MIPTAIPTTSDIKLKIGFNTPNQEINAEPNEVAIPIWGLDASVSIDII